MLLAACVSCGSLSDRSPGSRVIDEDGDGRTDRFELLGSGGAVERLTRAPAPGTDPERTLVLAIDGIPYDLFAGLQREGLFRAFFPASRMLAPFPSLTDVGFTAILRTAPSAAYEDKYYDREAGEVRGGLGERIAGDYRSLAPFHEEFDWEQPSTWGGFVYLAPGRVAEADLVRAAEFIRDSDDPELVVYLGSTDGLGHEEGGEALRRHLGRIDEVLEALLAEGMGDRRVVLLSDHGMSDGGSRRFDLGRALEEGGYRLADRIAERTDVVVPAYGLIGSIQLYTACGEEQGVARAIVSAEGADFAAWLDGDRVRSLDGAGSADPLNRPAETYPELRRRVAEGLRYPTPHPANVFVSLDPGWHYGLALFEPFVSLAGTHGSARYEQSVGFLASNVERTPAWLDAEDVYPHLGLGREPAEPPPFESPCGVG
ncbi:MAG TPA: alkaline phosphatase family protein [Gemmatimonadota bacterium]|nr:alkaline phosphatase family protein [Gemmatimonadota bacterium]